MTAATLTHHPSASTKKKIKTKAWRGNIRHPGAGLLARWLSSPPTASNFGGCRGGPGPGDPHVARPPQARPAQPLLLLPPPAEPAAVPSIPPRPASSRGKRRPSRLRQRCPPSPQRPRCPRPPDLRPGLGSHSGRAAAPAPRTAQAPRGPGSPGCPTLPSPQPLPEAWTRSRAAGAAQAVTQGGGSGRSGRRRREQMALKKTREPAARAHIQLASARRAAPPPSPWPRCRLATRAGGGPPDRVASVTEPSFFPGAPQPLEGPFPQCGSQAPRLPATVCPLLWRTPPSLPAAPRWKPQPLHFDPHSPPRAHFTPAAETETSAWSQACRALASSLSGFLSVTGLILVTNCPSPLQRDHFPSGAENNSSGHPLQVLLLNQGPCTAF
ncbi:basic proline-rich protein-like [Nannospalax galili]|uniref:basic proline-rich protein-like n=1 Tax=Nannospalax galili TaxID=1026970 RepID=UPI0004ED16CE|nr:basic proline-rich protein-like [Nannospalax galili]